MKSGLYSLPFFTAFKILFILVRLAFMVASTDLWHRLTNIPHLDFPGFNYYEGARAKPKAAFKFNAKKQPVPESGSASLAKSLILILGMKVIKVAGSQLGLHLPVPLTLG